MKENLVDTVTATSPAQLVFCQNQAQQNRSHTN